MKKTIWLHEITVWKELEVEVEKPVEVTVTKEVERQRPIQKSLSENLSKLFVSKQSKTVNPSTHGQFYNCVFEKYA